MVEITSKTLQIQHKICVRLEKEVNYYEQEYNDNIKKLEHLKTSQENTRKQEDFCEESQEVLHHSTALLNSAFTKLESLFNRVTLDTVYNSTEYTDVKQYLNTKYGNYELQ